MICIPILARDTREAEEKIRRAERLADLLEIRLDVMGRFDLHGIIRAAAKPVIVTYRSRQEGGKGKDCYATVARYLCQAAEAGVDFIDIEYSMPGGIRKKIFEARGNSMIIVSTHLLNGTPDRDTLEDLMKKMAATGADVIKIVTRAETVEDNLRVLELIAPARGLGLDIITFCLGSKGRISRIISPLLGGYLTFASLEEGEESAEGQIPAKTMKTILEVLRT
ncbi:MAG: type I 3-dehydroquinate dehydratase [Deltaproteobacteria bacterium]|nr:type I 3-dehydroquinate dehydratase [Deltaproteobacteria bacterium]MBW2017865.1 type I 3-dehydroquinate dehydratase [Deltaproteobacteria bacterium]MBW2129821.1 type I 3-dehydroquinate dehydratase [Deltaproteobacteria bacterium]MBW2304902.1 type I 3-dehydroquinate dehydratase [Deltaproteobacteria bacterium]